MLRFIAGRLQHLVLVVFAITVLSFLLIYLSGDPLALLLPIDTRPGDRERIAAIFGLDQPIWRQYLSFAAGAARGDLGASFHYNRDALGMVLGRLPATISLALAAMTLAVIVAVPLGIAMAARADSLFDWVASIFTFLGISLPGFWLGIMLILLFTDHLRWLPPSGRGTWQHMVLPAVTLAMFPLGLLVRLVRATVLETLRQDYVRTARAKGLAERVVLYRHALRSAMIPLVTVMGLQLGNLLGGSLVIESVFAWPGVGWLLLQGIGFRDIPLVRAVVLVIGVAFVLINFTVDLLYGWLDPRIRREA